MDSWSRGQEQRRASVVQKENGPACRIHPPLAQSHVSAIICILLPENTHAFTEHNMNTICATMF